MDLKKIHSWAKFGFIISSKNGRKAISKFILKFTSKSICIQRILHSNVTNSSSRSLKELIPISLLLKCKMLNLVQICGKIDEQLKPVSLAGHQLHFNSCCKCAGESWKTQLAQAWRSLCQGATVNLICLYKGTKCYYLNVKAGVHTNTSYTRIHHIFKCHWFFGEQVLGCDTNTAYYYKLGYRRTHVQVHAAQEWSKLK